MLILGNIYPVLSFLFYLGIVLSTWLFIKHQNQLYLLYSFFAPYFLVLGIAMWNYIFPYYTGIVLALLLGELSARILKKGLDKRKGTIFDFVVFPVFLFLFDFIFQKTPLSGYIHMIPWLSPIAKDHLIIKGAGIFGASGLLLFLTLTIAGVTKLLAERRLVKIPLLVLAVSLALVISPNFLISYTETKSLDVAVLQGSYKPGPNVVKLEDYYQDKQQHYFEAGSGVKADLLVFPETTFGIFDTSGSKDHLAIGNVIELFKDAGKTVVFNAIEENRVTKDKGSRYISALVVEEGLIKGLSRKRNLVPFSETKSFTKGDNYEPIDTAFGKLGVSVCYDINGKTIRELKKSGAVIIAAPFNDGGFGATYHNIHRYYPVIKAAEYGIPIAVANEDGISQIIDHQGKTSAELGFGKTGWVDSKVRLTNESSPYLLWGEKFELLLFVALLLWFAGAIRLC